MCKPTLRGTEKGGHWMKKVSMALLMVLTLLGCATMERDNAVDQERILTAAGFKMIPADTPDKRNKLALLPQKQIITRDRNGKTVFLFADSSGCQCLYVGNEKAFQNYQTLWVQHNIAEQQFSNVETGRGQDSDWGFWEPWNVDGPMDYYMGW